MRAPPGHLTFGGFQDEQTWPEPLAVHAGASRALLSCSFFLVVFSFVAGATAVVLGLLPGSPAALPGSAPVPGSLAPAGPAPRLWPPPLWGRGLLLPGGAGLSAWAPG